MHAAMDFDKFEEELEIPRRFSSGKIGLRDDFEIDFNDISRASTPMSSMSTKSEGRRKDRSTSNHHASNRSRETKHHSTEDYKRKIARLKSELELEKAHNKQMYREKANEIKLIRESYAHDKSQEIRRIEQKMNMEKEKEVEILQKNLNRRKDEELQQVLKFKENEIKSLNERLEKEKKDSMDAVRYEEKQLYKRNVTKMQEEVKRLNDEKKKVEEDLKKKIRDESKRNKEVTEMKENYDAELRRIINESKKLAMGNLQKLKKAERALVEGAINEDDDISLPDRFTPFMDSLSRPLSRITPMSEASSRAPSVFDMKLEDLKLEDLRIEDMDIELLLASAAPAPSAFKAVTPRSANKSATGINSPGLPSKSPSVLSTKSPGPISLHSPSIHSEVESVSLSRRLSEDKDRQLQKKVTELQTQTQRLERKIGVLKTENETLKRKQNEQLPLEDKIKTLKKRNAELAAIARRLEEKAKHLQQENLKKLKEETGQLDNDYLKKMFARQRAKDLAEHAKAMLAKDREIEDLRKKCQELADQLSNSDILAPENMQMYEEKEELVSIIKQAAKERLLMEKQIAKTKPPVTTQAEAKKLKELETANEALQFEIKKLERVKSETEKIEEELAEKKIECEKLQEEIKKEKAKSRLLEDELEESNVDKSKLSTQVKELHAKLKALEKVTEECNILRLSLSEAQNECDVARNERNTLQTKVLDLENVVKTLQESADKLNKLENDYKVTKHKLNDKQSEILSIQRNNDLSRKEYEETIATLKVKLSELENTCHNQEQQHKNLTEEIKLLQAASYKPPSIDSGTYSEDLQTAHATVQESTSTARLDRVADGYHANNSKSVETGMNRALTAHPKQNETKKVGNQASDSQFEDPELIEISQKLKELEASDSEEELTPTGGKGHDLMMNNHLEPKMKTDSGNSQEESRLSLLGKKGPIHVYMAKYTYDPFQHSPNDNPDAELAINAGDYVLIYGDMDEDAFFEGELLDGRRGLVPSNFIEKVPDEDLSEFHAAMAAMGHIEEDGPVQASAVSLEQELNFDSSEETDEKQLDKHTKPSAQAKELPIEITSPGGDNSQNSTSSTLDISKSPTQLSTKYENTDLLCPVNLTLDRQLTNSILISWSPPPCLADDPDKLDIKAYHVFVDNEFKTIVRGHERTKALVENVDSTVVHRVSVRCISNKGTSEDAQCTLLIGKDAVPLPSQLTVCDISANSATVTWLPGNSNYQHSISLNGKEVRVLKPSICKYKLTGLAPSSENHIVVTAKPPTSTDWGDHLIARLTFKTIAGGLPDPPINVQVESGPQEGTLLLTWLPVTIDSTGFSNGALVKGYVVYADGKWTKEVIGATNDHVVLNSGNFKGFVPKQLVVRTVTQAGDESVDSVVVRLPQSLIKEITAGAAKSLASEVASKFEEAKKGKPLSPDVALKRHEGSSQDMNVPRVYSPDDHYEDDFVDSSASSELSDIPEVEEDFHSEVSSRASTPKRKSPHADDLRRVKTKDGKLSASGHSASHHSSHNTSLSGDVTPVRSPILNRVVPAIEITRDSSSERGNSFDVSEDDAESPPKHKHRSRSSSPRRKSPEDISSQDDDMTPRNTSFSPTVNNQSDETANKVKNIPGKHDSMHTNAHLPKISVINNVSKDDKSRRSPVQGRKAHGNHSTSSKTSDSPKRHKNINGLSDLDRDTNDNELKSKGTAHSSHKHPDVPSLNLKDIVDNSMEESGDIDSISGEINPPVVETCVRLFVALFDYDPHTMSPNVDALDEELPFKEGQIIKIYGDKDADGFYRGESNGRVGFVPCNMVSELQVDDPDLAEQLLRDSQESFHSNGLLKGPEDSSHYLKSMESLESGHSSQIIPNGLSPALGQPSGTMKRMIAMYDYDPQELSPNVDSEVELSFQSGDIIYVFGDMDDDGFYMGESNGQRGLVPSNFLQEAPLVEEESPTIKSNMNSASHRQKWDQPQWNQYHRIG